MESQKIIKLLEQSDNDGLKFQTRKWYVINDQNNGQYGKGDRNDSTIKFSTEIIKSFLTDYSDAYILVTCNIAVVGGNNNTKIAFKNCHPFTRSVIHLNDEHVDTAENLDITMNMHNLIEYSDNYTDTAVSLYQNKKPEKPKGNDGALVNITNSNSSSFEYKLNIIKIAATDVAANVNPDIPGAHKLWKNAKIAVPLKYMSNFSRSLELALINTKFYIELNWTKHSVMNNVAANITTFQITKTELYVPVVTLNTDSNKKLSDLLIKGSKRSVFWNEYKSKIQTETTGNVNENISLNHTLLDASYQGVNRLFLMGFNNANVQRNSNQKYFLPRVDIKYNVLLDGRNFYDQHINDKIKNYDEVRRIALRKGDDYTTGCLLDYSILKMITN